MLALALPAKPFLIASLAHLPQHAPLAMPTSILIQGLTCAFPVLLSTTASLVLTLLHARPASMVTTSTLPLTHVFAVSKIAVYATTLPLVRSASKITT